MFGIFEPLEFEILKATFNTEETRRVVVGIQRGKWSGIAINGQSPSPAKEYEIFFVVDYQRLTMIYKIL